MKYNKNRQDGNGLFKQAYEKNQIKIKSDKFFILGLTWTNS